jgi:hypothetical protein
VVDEVVGGAWEVGTVGDGAGCDDDSLEADELMAA